MRKRNLSINIRVTENEKSNICSKAKRSGLSLSEYIRKCALGQSVRSAPNKYLKQAYQSICQMFIAQLACSILFFKQDSKEKRFLNIPVISLSYTALIVSIIVGAVAMVVPFIPYWVGIILDVLIVAFYAIAIISSKAAADTIENIDNKVK